MEQQKVESVDSVVDMMKEFLFLSIDLSVGIYWDQHEF
jgi:hypothetical protein